MSPRLPEMPASDAGCAAVAIENLAMTYGEKVAVDSLTLSVERNTITAVLGPNGAGKTTTLETCEGYRVPHQGTVRVLGLDPNAQRRELLPRIGVMLQSGGAWSGVRAVEMLSHVASLHAHPLEVPMLVERLGLGECGRTPYRRLSGGQQQRLALAMAVVGRPELVFVDEPTAGMDPQGRRTTWALLQELRGDGVTIVLTTHYMDEAERLCDRVAIVDHGRAIALGSPRELIASLGAEHVVEFTSPEAPSGALSVDSLQMLDGVHAVREVGGRWTLEVSALSRAVPALLAELQARGAPLGELATHSATLEDVFVSLTGRQLRDV